MSLDDVSDSLKQTPVLRPVVWLGNSKENLMDFPKEALKVIGDELRLIQYGEMPNRTVVAVQLGRKIYVLHVSHKKSRRGIETPQQDVELIKQRYKEAQERARNEQADE